MQAYSLAEPMKRLIPENSLTVQMAKQWQESQKAEQESIRRMLDPLEGIRKGFLADSATKRMLDNLAKPFSASEQTAKLKEQTMGSSAFIRAMHSK